METTIRTVLLAIFQLAVFLVLFVNLTGITANFAANPEHKNVVSADVPDTFPVLVLVPAPLPHRYAARIIYWGQLKSFTAKNPEYTFSIPAGLESSMRDQILKSNRAARSDFNSYSQDPWRSWFTIGPADGDWQSLQVACTWDADRENQSWYLARGKEIKPQEYLTYVTGTQLGVILITLVEALIIFGLAHSIIRWFNVRINTRKHQYSD